MKSTYYKTIFLALLFSTSLLGQVNTNRELLAFYPFSGNSKNSLNPNYPADLFGTQFSNDRYGKTRSACAFNGYDDYVRVAMEMPAEFSLTFWFKRQNKRTNVWLAGWHNGEQPVGFFITDSETNDYAINQWFHVVLVAQTDGSLKTYIDGKLKHESKFIPGDYSTFTLAKAESFNAFAGKIDDVLIYERAINMDEIRAIFHNQLNYKEDDNRLWVPVPNTDIALNIPKTNLQASKTYAVVIGNEDYSRYMKSDANSDVLYAKNDAVVFKEYAEKTFGIPKENIKLLLNATLGQMRAEIDRMKNLAKADSTNSFVFYFAGHGMPDEKTKEGYLVPVDASPFSLSNTAIKINDLYASLNQYPSRRVTVFLDACFSGALTGSDERAVKVKPKEADQTAIKGNFVVFTSSSDEEYSKIYKEKKHGMFTYFLLKKIQETGGNISYGELAEFIKSEVNKTSLNVYYTGQEPQIIFSPQSQNSWNKWKIVSR